MSRGSFAARKMNLGNALKAIRSVGPRIARLAVRYSLWRDQVEARYRAPSGPSEPVSPGGVREVSPVPSGVAVRFEAAELEVVFVAPDIVRLSWSPGTPPLPYAVPETTWPEIEVSLQSEGDAQVLSTAELQVRIGPAGEVQIYDGAGCLLRDEQPPERRGAGWSQRWSLHAEESVYGLGERAGPLDLRGGTFRAWNHEPVGYGPGADPLYLTVPACLFLRREASCLVFWDNPADGVFTFPQAGPAEVRFRSGMLRCYVMAGPPSRALERYTRLTGRPPLPPAWALGYHQSRWGYRSHHEITALVERFRELGLPLDAVHLDIDYMDGYRVFTVDPSRFPDLKALSDRLQAVGVRLVTILDPGVKVDAGFSLFRDGEKRGMFCTLPDGRLAAGVAWPGEVAFPDFTDPEARRWWGEQYGSLVAQGVDGFWHDMNEPACMTAWGDTTLPLPTRHCLEGRGGDHAEAHNVYALLMNQAGFEALRRLRPEARPWLLSRSGWAGLQRYAWTWTGDSETSWAALRTTIATVLNLGLSGIPFSGSDIGGFSGSPEPELYLRWLQMAAFMPFFRTHSIAGVPPREPWVYGEPTLSRARECLQLRRRLLPYLYTLAWEASRTGQPPVRPLFWADPSDPSLWRVDDAFLLGDALLVAPVLEPGAGTRRVRLPAGEWFSLWDDRPPVTLSAGAEIEVETCPERLPVFVRGGSLLPLQDEDGLRLHFYGRDAGDGTLYTDAGDGYGDWRVDRFTVRRERERLELTVRGEGAYPAPPEPPPVVDHPVR